MGPLGRPPGKRELPLGIFEFAITGSVLLFAVWELHKTNKEIAEDKRKEAARKRALRAAEEGEQSSTPAE